MAAVSTNSRKEIETQKEIYNRIRKKRKNNGKENKNEDKLIQALSLFENQTNSENIT